jgi:hypothetical protein
MSPLLPRTYSNHISKIPSSQGRGHSLDRVPQSRHDHRLPFLAFRKVGNLGLPLLEPLIEPLSNDYATIPAPQTGPHARAGEEGVIAAVDRVERLNRGAFGPVWDQTPFLERFSVGELEGGGGGRTMRSRWYSGRGFLLNMTGRTTTVNDCGATCIHISSSVSLHEGTEQCARSNEVSCPASLPRSPT